MAGKCKAEGLKRTGGVQRCSRHSTRRGGRPHGNLGPAALTLLESAGLLQIV